MLADTLRDLPASYSRIVIFAKGLGGLVAKAAIAYLIRTKQRLALAKLAGLFLVSVPQAGLTSVPWYMKWASADFAALAAHSKLAQESHQIFIDHVECDSTATSLEKIRFADLGYIECHDVVGG